MEVLFMNNYEGTIKFWDERFGNILSDKEYYKPNLPLSMIEVEEGLKWLIKDSDS